MIRRLTDGEQALASEVFGSGLNPRRVRIFAIPIWPRAFVAGPGLMVWPRHSVLADFASSDVPLQTQGVFVHELAHVWQAQNGVSLILGKLRAGDSPRAYAYDISGDADFSALNIEQQAMVIEHAFLASRGGQTPHEPGRYAAMRGAWRT